MMIKTSRIVLAGLLCVAAASTAVAQDFCIRTHIYNMSGVMEAGGRPPVEARSLTIFHAGKVYDYVDTVEEVIIFEPIQDRFTIINKSKMIMTVVHFTELKRLLQVATEETQALVQKLHEEGSEKSLKDAMLLRFQLEPNFHIDYSERQKQISMASPNFKYTAVGATTTNPEVPAIYLNYADWTTRLNSILQRRTLPGPRLALNDQFRRHNLMPTSVELQAELGARVHLRAEHTIYWQLESNELSQIRIWEDLLQRPDLKSVSFREFVMAGVTKR